MKPYREALLEWQRNYVQQALDACDGSIIKAAKLIGLNRTHLHKFAAKLGVRWTKREQNYGNAAWQALRRTDGLG